MSCYDLTLKYIEIMGDIDRVIEKKSKASNDDNSCLETEINKLKVKLFEMKKILKVRECYHLIFKYIEVLKKIGKTIEKNQKIKSGKSELLDTKIDNLEIKMFEIQDELKSKDIC